MLRGRQCYEVDSATPMVDEVDSAIPMVDEVDSATPSVQLEPQIRVVNLELVGEGLCTISVD